MDSSPDTEAVLLLCANLGNRQSAEFKPLTARQYNTFVSWLHAQGLRPSDLLDPEAMPKLDGIEMDGVTPDRITFLVNRGVALAFMRERWGRESIWIVSSAAPDYPKRLKRYLGDAAPPILFGIGAQHALGMGGLAVVGSRDRSDEDSEYARRIGDQCARQGIPVISGAAKGIDRDAMSGALEAAGTAIGVLAEGLSKQASSPELRGHISSGRLTLLSTCEPEAHWQAWMAMERNKFLYGLSDAALVVACGDASGGTWAGATEALRAARTPVFVKNTGALAPGNGRLLSMGALAFPAEPWSDFRELFVPVIPQPRPAPAKRKRKPAPEPAPSPPPEVPNAYTLVLPELLRVLTEPRDEKTLARLFDVRPPQMKDWLQRAIAEEHVVKSKRPKGYVLRPSFPPEPSPQGVLFETMDGT